MTLVGARWDEARSALAREVRPLPSTLLPVGECDGLVLAADLVARTALPSFDTSAMDGWAVAGAGPWRLVGESLAGRPLAARLAPGSAAVIATGAVVPGGTDAVIRSEDGQVTGAGEQRRLTAATPDRRSHVRPAGEECAAGEVLAPAGTHVGPALLGLAAAAGHDALRAVPQAKVALVLFGDELVDSGIPAIGRVRDSLGPQVPAWVTRLGARPVRLCREEDTLDAHVAAIQGAASGADLVLTTGGTAAGPVDHLHRAIAEVGGALVVDSVAVRPGHPMLAATVPSSPGRPVWLVGLPGNPQSAVVTLMTLAAPLLAGLAGRDPLPPLEWLVAAEEVPAPAHEDRLVLGTRDASRFTPGSHLGSGMLRGLAGASGFGVLPPGGVHAGDPVRWLPLPL